MAVHISPDDKGVNSLHVEDGQPPLANQDEELAEDLKRIREYATLATNDEHNTTFIEGIKRYPKAIAWSALISLCIIMDGYDTALMASLFGFPAFQKQYGYQLGNTGKYVLHAEWQVALGMANPVGNVVGITLNGYLTDRFGHKPVLHAGLFALIGFIFIQFFSTSVQVLFVSELLCGIPWGIFSTMAPAFASEVVPLSLRSYLETWVVVCWGIGQYISYAILFSLNGWDNRWAYRIPFAIQWVWPVIIIPIAAFCPESPWWHVRKGHYEKAERSVMRLTSAENKEVARDQAKKAVALMIETNQLEEQTKEETSYLSCFQGSDLWRTEIGCVSWGIQIITGFVIQNYAVYFFQQAGLSVNNSFKMTLGMGAIHLVCNGASAALTGNYGRRTLFVNGCFFLAVLMLILGFLALGPLNTKFGFATSAVYLIWYAVWCLTIGPLPYIINGEVSSTRLRSKTMALARGTYQVLSIINTVVAPYILNPEQANWRGKAGFLTGGLTVLCLVWAYFRLPETGRRTFEELDILFEEKGMTARHFSKAVIRRDNGEIEVSGPHKR
ncbi:Sugar/inositol transporter [Niveomyces insectorum RCEF 264]|uniref:Sugar/inositol transporter n=1 Tax=Niveomyces insectorum RCEF 264 TaxID=1081102 RepID=A0A167RDV9_9HYPO|nr:Sugar/inositol transporter [Niveomyces insectorum RCEF 264]